jgi:hypothetical protein
VSIVPNANSVNSFVNSLTSVTKDALNTVLSSKNTIALLLVVAVAAFALGYLFGKPSTGKTPQQNKMLSKVF